MEQNGLVRVGLYVTCLVDLFRPVVGFAAIKLLQEAGCEVRVPLEQTCCGQPAFNSGDRKQARALALAVIDRFEDFDYVVAPSGSCAGMLKMHYPALFADNPRDHKRALDFASKVHELVSFLVDVRGLQAVEADFIGRITLHDACAGLREMGVGPQPRQLLGAMNGVELVDLADREACCGFGGTFSVKYPEISDAMVSKKSAAVVATKAGVLLSGDLGCLMNIAGKLSREGQGVEVRHIAEVLAGLCDEPPIAGPRDSGNADRPEVSFAPKGAGQ